MFAHSLVSECCCSMLAVIFVLFCLIVQQDSSVAVDPVHYGQPEQVHLSFGVGPTEMVVTWMTFEEKKNYTALPTVEYSIEQQHLNQTQTGVASFFLNGNRISFNHRVWLRSLLPDTIYYYRVGNEENGWSTVFNFKTRPIDQENWSPRIAIYGDLGYNNGRSIPFLKNQISNNAYDAVFHVGDLAYNLDFNNGELGDKFMREMEPIMAHVAYQTTVGNHESYGNFTYYNSRFSMINEQTGVMNNYFYSFNIGPAHVIGFSSEFYYYINYGFIQIHNQYRWLEQDLLEATKPENLAKRPWIIAMAHRPMYCSTDDSDDCTANESLLRKGIPVVYEYGLEDLFYKYGVDIIIGAHEHTYERLYPVYNRKVYNGSDDKPYVNPKAPIHLLVGSAGCPEDIDPFVPYPKPWSAKRISDYGITEMNIVNKTHIRLRQRSTDKNGLVVDTVTFVKEKHGAQAWL